MHKLVLIRHGEYRWDLKNRLSGWMDVELAPTSAAQASHDGEAKMLTWRRNYDTPPALEPNDPSSARGDLRYAKIRPRKFP